MMRTVDWRVQWRPGTRFADAFEYDLIDWDGTVSTVKMTPRYEFQMRGIGYGNPEFGHGWWKGESVTGGEPAGARARPRPGVVRRGTSSS